MAEYTQNGNSSLEPTADSGKAISKTLEIIAGSAGPDLGDQLVAHFKFNETTGDLTLDSASGADATAIPDMDTIGGYAGKIENAVDFSGSDYGVVINDKSKLSTLGFPMSISFWFEFTGYSYNSFRVFELTDENTNSTGFFLYYGTESSGSFSPNFYATSSGATVDFQDNEPMTSLPIGWNHLVVIASDVAGQSKIYLNGQQATSDYFETISGTPTITTDTSIIGSISPTYGGNNEVRLDDLRIYNKILSEAEIAAIYNGGDGTESEDVVLGQTSYGAPTLIANQDKAIGKQIETTFGYATKPEIISFQNFPVGYNNDITVPAGTELLIVSFHDFQGAPGSVTFNEVPMTFWFSDHRDQNGIDVYYLVGPDIGTYNLNNSYNYKGFAWAIKNVHPSDPIGGYDTEKRPWSESTVSISATIGTLEGTNSLILDHLEGVGDSNPPVEPSEPQVIDYQLPISAPRAASHKYAVNASSATMEWHKVSGPSWEGYGIVLAAMEIRGSESAITASATKDISKTLEIVAPPESSLIMHLRLNDNAASTVVIDSSNVANNGTATINTQEISTTGKILSSLNGSGSEWVDFPHNQAYELTGGFTITGWVRIDNPPPNNGYGWGVFFKGDATFQAPYLWVDIYPSGDDAYIELAFERQGNYMAVLSDPLAEIIVSGNWFHFAFVLDGIDNRIYLNGAEHSDPNNDPEYKTVLPLLYDNTHDIRILSWLDGSGSIEGDVDDIRFYSRPLSEEEVSQVYNSGAGTEEEDVVLGQTSYGAPTLTAGSTKFIKKDLEATISVTGNATRLLALHRELGANAIISSSGFEYGFESEESASLTPTADVGKDISKTLEIIAGSAGPDLGDELVAHFKFNDNAEDTNVLESITSTNGTLTENTSGLHVTGKVDGAITFGGTGDSVNYAATSGIIACTFPFSIAYWAKTVEVNPLGVPFSFDYDFVTGEGMQIYMENNYNSIDNFKFGFWAYDSGKDYVIELPDLPALTADTWYHFVVIATPDPADGKLYINGVDQGVVEPQDYGPVSLANITEPMIFGSETADVGLTLDDFRFYDKALSTEDIAALYNGGDGTESEDVVLGQTSYGAPTLTAGSTKFIKKDLEATISVTGDAATFHANELGATVGLQYVYGEISSSNFYSVLTSGAGSYNFNSGPTKSFQTFTVPAGVTELRSIACGIHPATETQATVYAHIYAAHPTTHTPTGPLLATITWAPGEYPLTAGGFSDVKSMNLGVTPGGYYGVQFTSSGPLTELSTESAGYSNGVFRWYYDDQWNNVGDIDAKMTIEGVEYGNMLNPGVSATKLISTFSEAPVTITSDVGAALVKTFDASISVGANNAPLRLVELNAAITLSAEAPAKSVAKELEADIITGVYPRTVTMWAEAEVSVAPSPEAEVSVGKTLGSTVGLQYVYGEISRSNLYNVTSNNTESRFAITSQKAFQTFTVPANISKLTKITCAVHATTLPEREIIYATLYAANPSTHEPTGPVLATYSWPKTDVPLSNPPSLTKDIDVNVTPGGYYGFLFTSGDYYGSFIRAISPGTYTDGLLKWYNQFDGGWQYTGTDAHMTIEGAEYGDILNPGVYATKFVSTINDVSTVLSASAEATFVKTLEASLGLEADALPGRILSSSVGLNREQDSYNITTPTNVGSWQIGTDGAEIWEPSQEFVAGGDIIRRIDVMLLRNDDKTLTLDILAADGVGKPTGPVLYTHTFAQNEQMPLTLTNYTVSHYLTTPLQTSPDGRYVVRLSATGATGYIVWRRVNPVIYSGLGCWNYGSISGWVDNSSIANCVMVVNEVGYSGEILQKAVSTYKNVNIDIDEAATTIGLNADVEITVSVEQPVKNIAKFLDVSLDIQPEEYKLINKEFSVLFELLARALRVRTANVSITLTPAIDIDIKKANNARIKMLPDNSGCVALTNQPNENFFKIANANAGPMKLTTAYSIEFWYKQDWQPINGDQGFFNTLDFNTYQSGYTFAFQGDLAGNTKLISQFFNSLDSSQFETVMGAYNIVDHSGWTHLAVTVDAPTQTAKFYVNGVLQTNNPTYTGAFYIDPSPAAYYTVAGTDHPIADPNCTNGLVSEFRLWDDVRSQAEIQANMSSRLVGNEAGLVGYWKLNGDATDSGPNGLDLENFNNPTFISGDEPFLTRKTPIVFVSKVLASSPVQPSINYTTSDYGPTLAAGVKSYEVTTSGADRMVLMLLSYKSGSISTINCNGSPMTLVVSSAIGSSFTEIWKFENAPLGSNTVEITVAGSSSYQWAVSVAAINNTSGTGATAFNNVYQAGFNKTISPHSAAGIVFDSAFYEGAPGSTIIAGADQSVIVNYTAGQHSSGISYKEFYKAPSVNMNWAKLGGGQEDPYSVAEVMGAEAETPIQLTLVPDVTIFINRAGAEDGITISASRQIQVNKVSNVSITFQSDSAASISGEADVQLSLSADIQKHIMPADKNVTIDIGEGDALIGFVVDVVLGLSAKFREDVYTPVLWLRAAFCWMWNRGMGTDLTLDPDLQIRVNKINNVYLTFLSDQGKTWFGTTNVDLYLTASAPIKFVKKVLNAALNLTIDLYYMVGYLLEATLTIIAQKAVKAVHKMGNVQIIMTGYDTKFISGIANVTIILSADVTKFISYFLRATVVLVADIIKKIFKVLEATVVLLADIFKFIKKMFSAILYLSAKVIKKVMLVKIAKITYCHAHPYGLPPQGNVQGHIWWIIHFWKFGKHGGHGLHCHTEYGITLFPHSPAAKLYWYTQTDESQDNLATGDDTSSSVSDGSGSDLDRG